MPSPKTIKALLAAKEGEVQTVQAEETVYDAIVRMDDQQIGSLLVLEGEEVVGIVTERDYLKKVELKGLSSKTTPVKEIMSSPPVVIGPEEKIERAMSIMTTRRCRHLPVMEGPRCVGMISIGDLVKATIADQKYTIRMLREYMAGPPTF